MIKLQKYKNLDNRNIDYYYDHAADYFKRDIMRHLVKYPEQNNIVCIKFIIGGYLERVINKRHKLKFDICHASNTNQIKIMDQELYEKIKYNMGENSLVYRETSVLNMCMQEHRRLRMRKLSSYQMVNICYNCGSG